jgi:FdhD protein
MLLNRWRCLEMVGSLDRTGRGVRRGSKASVRVQVVEGGRVSSHRDTLATEEPLAIRVQSGSDVRDVAITMRTPGADFELAAGFLFSEGIVRDRYDIEQLSYCVGDGGVGEQEYNVISVNLRSHAPGIAGIGERPFVMSSACGICGQANLDALSDKGLTKIPPGFRVAASVLSGLPERVRKRQKLFEATGGLHAAALCTPAGEVLAVREDVGRHNAVDKVIGWAMLEGKLPLRNAVMVVSGRAGFEITQKCLAAGVPVLAAVSAPSSLAVDAALEFGMTLVGFVRGERFNVYSGMERIVVEAAPAEGKTA